MLCVMALYEHTVEIHRPREDVFAFITYPANYPRWQPSLVAISPSSPGPLRVGTEATELRRFFGREVETTWTCVEHDRSRGRRSSLTTQPFPSAARSSSSPWTAPRA